MAYGSPPQNADDLAHVVRCDRCLGYQLAFGDHLDAELPGHARACLHVVPMNRPAGRGTNQGIERAQLERCGTAVTRAHMALLCGLTLVVVIGCAAAKGRYVSSQAFAYPQSRYLLVERTNGGCWADVQVHETKDAIRVSARQPSGGRPGSGACAQGARPVRLSKPVGSRAIGARTSASPGVSFDITTRLYRPLDPSANPYSVEAGFPADVHADPVHGGWAWTLKYQAQPESHGPDFVLTCKPATQRYTATAVMLRNTHAVKPCDAVVCWVEQNIVYAMTPLPNQQLTQRQAIDAASTLLPAP
jgi:hypothetical protein